MRRRVLALALPIAVGSVLFVTSQASGQIRPGQDAPPDTAAVPVQDTVPRPAADTIPPPVVDPAEVLPGDTIPELEGPDTIPGDTLGEGERQVPPDPEADAIIQQLRRLEGYVPTEYLGETAIYRTEEGVLRLVGDAQVEREGNRLNADTIVYRGNDDLVEAYGNPRVTGQSQELTGNVLYYDLVTRRATAIGARTELQQTAAWIVTGDVTVESTEETRIFATQGHFTTCDLAIPHYHFEADRVKIVQDKYLVGRPARLYFGRVPVMVLPFFVQSLEEGRRSGFIAPRFSFTDIVRNSGHTREITDLGWYWAINDYLGAQLTGRWRSGAYTALTGNLDFRWRRQFLNGNFAFTRYWQQSGRRDFTLNSSANWRPDERTNLTGTTSFTTSSQFIRESTIDPLEATQDLNSSFNLSRRFDWGVMTLGARARQSIADGGINYTLPTFSIQPNPITLFRSTTPDTRWYNDANIQWGLRATRSGTSGEGNFRSGTQDEQNTDVNANFSINLGRVSLSTSGQLNQSEREELTGFRFGNEVISPCGDDVFESLLGLPCQVLRGGREDRASWNASLGYQQNLIGSTTLTPSLGFSQEVRRDSLTDFEYLQAPMRVNFGASLSTAIFGFIEPGFGPFERIRHRISPTLTFTYSPAVEQNEAQRQAFGAIESRTQNVLTLNLNQTWEGRMRNPQRSPEADEIAEVMDTTMAGDTAAARANRPAQPQQEEKVTILSINTSALTYDFTRAQETGSGFTNTSINNSLKSDYLGGLSVQLSHDLFDQSEINPNDPAQRGQMGSFSPRLASLTTGFNLGPNSALFQWLGAIRRGLGGEESPATEGMIPGRATQPTDGDETAATGNPQTAGGGNWNASIDYSFSRPRRRYDPQGLRDDRAVQSVNLSTRLPLTPAWSADWRTSYSITDGEFSGHSLNFSRSLHRWQANFSFFQTATGNTGFQFFVELVDNRDLKFEYRERNLGIDR